jgi:hypothetical protein
MTRPLNCTALAALCPDGVRRDLLDGLAPAGAEDMGGGGGCRGGAVRGVVAADLVGDRGRGVIMHRLLGRVLRERDQAAGQWAGTAPSQRWECWSHCCSPRRRRGPGAAREPCWLSRYKRCGTLTPRRGPRTRIWRRVPGPVGQLLEAADLGRAIAAGTRTLTDSGRSARTTRTPWFRGTTSRAHAGQLGGRACDPAGE